MVSTSDYGTPRDDQCFLLVYTATEPNLVTMTSSNGNIFRYWPFVRGIHRWPGEFPAQRLVTRSVDVFFDLHLYRRLSKQSWGWWFETPLHSLWRHCNGSFTRWGLKQCRHFLCIFMNENGSLFIQISFIFVPGCSLGNKWALVQIMAWYRLGDKP